ncbi:hypothetical protein D3C81_1081960 [compost metagenome]
MYAEHRLGGAPGFYPPAAYQWADHDAAGFGLPPGVDDGAALLAHCIEIPLPGFRVDRFADAAEQAQALARSVLQRPITIAHQGAQGGGGGIENVYLVFVDHLPEARGVGVVGHAFEHQGDRAIGQRPVNDIAVPGHPADIGGAPEHFAFTVIEYGLESQGGLQQVAGGGVQHAFGFAGAAGGVEDEQRVFGVHRLGRAVIADLFDRFVVPEVAAFTPGDLAAGALDHHHRTDIRATEQRLVDVVLQRYGLGAANAFIGSDYGAAIGVEDTVTQSIG